MSNRIGMVAAVVALTIGATAVSIAEAPGFGCFVKVGDLQDWPAHVAMMERAGMNTFALLEWRSAEQLASMINTALDAGMLEPTVAVAQSGSLSASRVEVEIGTEAWQALLSEEPVEAPGGWYRGQFAGAAAVLDRARNGDTRWPEFLAYGVDEPGHGEDRALNLPHMAALLERAHAADMRLTSAVLYPHDRDCIPVLDVVMVCAIIGHDLPGTRAAIEAAGKEFWIYETSLRNSSPDLIRYHVGVWAWQTQARCYLNWDWTGLAQVDENGTPHWNERLEAYAQGVADYRYLAATAARLQELRDTWDGDLMPVDWWVANGPRWTIKSPIDLDNLLPSRESLREAEVQARIEAARQEQLRAYREQKARTPYSGRTSYQWSKDRGWYRPDLGGWAPEGWRFNEPPGVVRCDAGVVSGTH